jgi:short-subunit dehydrogenase
MRAGVETRRPPLLLGRTPQQVAQAGYDGFMARKRVVIPGIGNKFVSLLPRLLPRGMMLKVIESYQRDRGRRAENRKKRPKF